MATDVKSDESEVEPIEKAHGIWNLQASMSGVLLVAYCYFMQLIPRHTPQTLVSCRMDLALLKPMKEF